MCSLLLAGSTAMRLETESWQGRAEPGGSELASRARHHQHQLWRTKPLKPVLGPNHGTQMVPILCVIFACRRFRFLDSEKN